MSSFHRDHTQPVARFEGIAFELPNRKSPVVAPRPFLAGVGWFV
jgi:hypothetical protein